MLQLQFIIAPSIAVGLIVVSVLLFLLDWWLDDGYRDSGWALGGFLTGAFAIIAVLVNLALFIPYQGKYLTIEHPSGTVATTSYKGGVVIDGDSGTVYVLTLKGSPTQYIVNDDRATAYKVGDQISMACTLQWNYGAKDQWNCSLG